MVNYKKSQASAGSAALLVAIIAAMILLYTLFLPPADRAKLLEETGANSVSNENTTSNILLKESPGRLDLIKQSTIEHKISSFNLLSKTEGQLIKEFDSIYVQRTVFSDKPQTVQFDVLDPQNTNNLLLSFYPKDGRGRLTITLNNNVISENGYSSVNPQPISIPKSLLQKSNTLKFSVSNPGILFFMTNKYTLESVKIFGDVTDKSGLENSQGFFFTSIERQNLEKATLQLMPACKTNDVGRLDITINNQDIYSGIPDCEMPVKVDISPGKLLEGENKIKFTAEKGSYVIDQAKITSYLKEAIYPTYYFNIDQDTMNGIENRSLNVNMTVTFVQSTNDFQDVEVEINGRKFSIDNKDRVYRQTINSYLRDENNAITLRPLDGTVEVVELKIFKYDIDDDND